MMLQLVQHSGSTFRVQAEDHILPRKIPAKAGEYIRYPHAAKGGDGKVVHISAVFRNLQMVDPKKDRLGLPVNLLSLHSQENPFFTSLKKGRTQFLLQGPDHPADIGLVDIHGFRRSGKASCLCANDKTL